MWIRMVGVGIRKFERITLTLDDHNEMYVSLKTLLDKTQWEKF